MQELDGPSSLKFIDHFAKDALSEAKDRITIGKEPLKLIKDLKQMLDINLAWTGTVSMQQNMIVINKAKSIKFLASIDDHLCKIVISFVIGSIEIRWPEGMRKVRHQQLEIPLEDEALIQLFVQSKLLNSKGTIWQYMDYVNQSQAMICQMRANEFHRNLGLSAFLLYNSALCFDRLQMYQKALKNLQKIAALKPTKLRKQCCQLQLRVELKMGKLVTQDDERIKILREEEQTLMMTRETQKDFYRKQLLCLISFLNCTADNYDDKIGLLNHKKMHCFTLYNLALAAKKKQFANVSLYLFEFLIRQLKKQNQSSTSKHIEIRKNLIWKSLLNIAKIYQESQGYEEAINTLKTIHLEDPSARRTLRNKIKILTQTVKCEQIRSGLCESQLVKAECALVQTKQFKIISMQQRQLQNLLREPTKPKMKKQRQPLLSYLSRGTLKSITKRNGTCSQVSIESSRKLKGSLLSQQVNAQFKSQEDQFGEFAKVLHRFNELQNEIEDQIKENGDKKYLCSLIDQLNEFLQTFQNQSTIMHSQQEKIGDKIYESRLKILKWIKTIDKDRVVIAQLNKYLQIYSTGDKYKQKRLAILNLIAKQYLTMSDWKNAIKTYTDIWRLGELEALAKIAEIQSARENYSEAMKCLEKYCELKNNDINSQIKLAHAYSKMPTYEKKAIEMLNQILFTEKQTYEYVHIDHANAHHFEAAVLLLANIFESMECTRKAIEICESYVQINFGSYNVFYVLGLLYAKEGQSQKSFLAHLSVVRLNPSKIAAFVELVSQIKSNTNFRHEIIALLKKAFLGNHRCAELLDLMIEILCETCGRKDEPLTIRKLVQYAQLMEKMDLKEVSLAIEIESIYMWCFELIEDKKHQGNVLTNKDYQTVLIRLGEINLAKGNLDLSEKYFSKLLKAIEEICSKANYLKDQETVRLEIKIWDYIGDIKIKQRYYNEAIHCFEHCVRQNESTSEQEGVIHEKIGFCHFQLRNYEKALKHYERALEIYGETFEIYSSVSEQEFANRKRKILAKLSVLKGRAVRKKEPNLLRLHNLKLSISFCCLRLQDTKRAKMIFKEILAKECTNKKALKHLAHIFISEGDNQLCLQLADVLLKLYPEDKEIRKEIQHLRQFVHTPKLKRKQMCIEL